MTRPGPKPIPLKLKRLKGTAQKCRINHTEPEMESGVPDPPDWLIPEARKEWDKVVQQLTQAGVLCLVDGSMLAVYAQLYGRFVVAQRTGEPVTAAMVTQLRVLAGCFGLEPSSRTRLSTVKPKGEENKWDF